MRVAIVGVVAVVAGLSGLGWLQSRAEHRVVTAGFWFEDVSLGDGEIAAERLGGGLTAGEMRTVAAVARSELRAAFAGLRIDIGDVRDARFSVRVVQQLELSARARGLGAAGESRGVWPLGGHGAVSFRVLASQAIAHAPPETDRAGMVEAIGRGIGRAAAHELAHQIAGSIDQRRDRRAYDYWNADRAEQFYGAMHWEAAGPRLAARLGTTSPSR